MKEDKQSMYRHSMSHVLAKAIKTFYPNAKMAIGPAIDNGFYYDFDNLSITPDDFDKIEEKMRSIIANNEDFIRREVSKTEALEMFVDEPYKIELINELPSDEKITVYFTGDDFYDLCRGPHVENTKFLRGFSFKINRISGAYWRGSEKNKMLTRIYVYGFLDKDDLKECLRLEAEAKERDHRKLGKELGIFMMNDLVGKGLPMWLPKGFIVRRELSDYIINKEIELGYQHVMTPSLGNVNLYKTSGHWEHYKDDMFPVTRVEGRTRVDVVIVVDHVHGHVGDVPRLDPGDVEGLVADGDPDVRLLRSLDAHRHEGRTHACSAYAEVASLRHDVLLDVLVDCYLHETPLSACTLLC